MGIQLPLVAKHWFTQAKKLGQGLAADGSWQCLLDLPGNRFRKEHGKWLFLLKEEKMENLEMSGNKGITFTSEIIFFPPN